MTDEKVQGSSDRKEKFFMTHQSLFPVIATDPSAYSASRVMSPVNIFSKNAPAMGRSGTPPGETLFKTLSPILAQLKSDKDVAMGPGRNLFNDKH